jgi:hypothetical protein
MRKDMQYVLIDRPRKGSRGKFYRPHIDLDENEYSCLPISERMKDRLEDTRQFSDLIGPVIRYLRSKVGQNWNKIWSDICKNSNGYMGKHLRDHIEWCVVLPNRHCNYKYFYEFLVDDNNILRINGNKYRKVKEKKPENKIVSLDKVQYFLHDDIWYRVKMEQLTDEHKRTFHIKDAFLGHVYRSFAGTIDFSIFYNFYGRSSFCVNKKQANSRECKSIRELL